MTGFKQIAVLVMIAVALVACGVRGAPEAPPQLTTQQ